jgi:hypothetical protein
VSHPLPPTAGLGYRVICALAGGGDRYRTADHAARFVPLVHDLPPKIGAVVLYDTRPFGDAGLYVGHGHCLAYVPGTGPLLRSLDGAGWHGKRRGWVTGANFRSVTTTQR